MTDRDSIRTNLLRWIEDLETTDAGQCREALCKRGSYCCLGRALVVMGIPCDNHPWVNGENGGSSEWLTAEERTALGLTDEDHAACYRMNDDDNKTFPEIAAWLRENVLPRYV